MRRRHKLFSVLLGFLSCFAVGVTAMFVSLRVESKHPTEYVQDQPADVPEGIQLPVPPQLEDTKAIHVPILMYHYIEHVKDKNDTFRQKLDIKPEILDRQLTDMQQRGYTFLTASELDDIIDGKQPLPAKPVLLTFDDGYRDYYTDAFPILKKHQAKSTAYIISGFIGKPNNMRLQQLLEVSQSGIVEIGAHTIHHIDLKHAPFAQAEKEITESRTQLEKITGQPVTSFAYPAGRYNPQAVEIVKMAGFRDAMTTDPGTAVTPGNRFVLQRLRPGDRVGKELIEFLEHSTT